MQQRGLHYYHFPLFTAVDAQLLARIPAVCFQIDSKLVIDPDHYDLSGFDMVQLAMNLVRATKADWKWGSNTKIIKLEGKEGTAATKILDRVCLDEACSLLATDTLLVSIPNACTLLVTAFDKADPLPDSFVKQTYDAYHKLVYQQISDLAFVYNDGVITQAIDMRKGCARAIRLPLYQHLDLTARQQFSFKEVQVFTGDYYYSAEIGSQDDKELVALCDAAIHHLLTKSRDREDFLGIIEFTTIEAITPYSTSLDDRLTKFGRMLEESLSLQEEVEMTNRTIEICFRFGGDNNNESNRRKLIRIRHPNH